MLGNFNLELQWRLASPPFLLTRKVPSLEVKEGLGWVFSALQDSVLIKGKKVI